MAWTSIGILKVSADVGQVYSAETGDRKGVPGTVLPPVNFDDRQHWPLLFEGS